MTILGQDIGREVCEIFKLDPSMVRHVELHMVAGEPLRVIVHRYATDEEAKELVDRIEEYALVRGVMADDKTE